jgi:hypothetical protein
MAAPAGSAGARAAGPLPGRPRPARHPAGRRLADGRRHRGPRPGHAAVPAPLPRRRSGRKPALRAPVACQSGGPSPLPHPPRQRALSAADPRSTPCSPRNDVNRCGKLARGCGGEQPNKGLDGGFAGTESRPPAESGLLGPRRCCPRAKRHRFAPEKVRPALTGRVGTGPESPPPPAPTAAAMTSRNDKRGAPRRHTPGRSGSSCAAVRRARRAPSPAPTGATFSARRYSCDRHPS